MSSVNFTARHIGPDENEIKAMLETIGVDTLDTLTEETVPASIRLKKPLLLPQGIAEHELSEEIKKTGLKNQVFKSYIGLGYYNCYTPAVIMRNVFENPGWYTAYTPYQAEIAQGRLEALLNFQTVIKDLTGMEIAGASLLDEATAAAEAMLMFFHARSREAEKRGANRFFVSEECFPQTIDVLKTRSTPLGIELVIAGHQNTALDESYFGALIQYPACNGEVYNYSEFVRAVHSKEIQVAVAADIMSLLLLNPPGEWDADAVLGSTQRFGIPLGFGGPHAAYFAAKEKYKREMPGRIIGVSIDAHGNKALRMSLQTREQHIRREKATSNICTSQVLLAVMASMYAVYHGPKGLKTIAERIHNSAKTLVEGFEKLGFAQLNKSYFDTIKIKVAADKTETVKKLALENCINFRYMENDMLCISTDETTSAEDVQNILKLFASVSTTRKQSSSPAFVIDESQQRKTPFLTHPVFNSHHSESAMMRYIKQLENKDISLTHSMISLGSCTMKLNAATEMFPLSDANFAGIHPFVPLEQAAGYMQIIEEIEKYLCEITGFSAVSFQPNSGAQGEYAGLLVIREYHKQRGNSHRNIVLIPASAHGTNPASAVIAGLQVVVVKCDECGNIDVSDLQEKTTLHKDNLCALMVTYPSTHGVFEEGIIKITKIIHENGGQVYMDGANMNAQVGLTSPAVLGADVCHLNLHKTFAVPHGGGGPGMGPIAVATHLVPYLPSHPLVKRNNNLRNTTAVSAAPFGSALILLISYAYIKMMGGEGLTLATKAAILNANYLKEKLEPYYPVLYKGEKNRVAHEMILDCRQFKTTAGIEVEDIAKRLMDYGFHAPTISFPVHGTMMVEPTESEPKAELDRFCEALISIRNEIQEVENGIYSRQDNVLKNAPHTIAEVTKDKWHHAYSRQKAAFPSPWLNEQKIWPSVGRVDNAYGDRNLVCSCPAVEFYETHPLTAPVAIS